MTIEFNHVSFEYPSSKKILNNTHFSLTRGEFVGVMGPNGGGKTTFAKLLNGTLLPTNGNIIVDNLDTAVNTTIQRIKNKVAYVGSDPENQLVTTTVYDEIAFSLQAQSLNSPKEIRDKVEETIDVFNLRTFVDLHPFYLSMGQRFQVLVAIAYARETNYIILDEVLSMLDSKNRENLLNRLSNVMEGKNTGIIMLTHRIEDLVSASRISVLYDGQIFPVGSYGEVVEKIDDNPQWNISLPPSVKLINKLPENTKEKLSSVLSSIKPI